MLHWGLENDQLTGSDLELMPVDSCEPTSPFTRLSAFKAVREFLRAGHDPVFDNHFSRRLAL